MSSTVSRLTYLRTHRVPRLGDGWVFLTDRRPLARFRSTGTNAPPRKPTFSVFWHVLTCHSDTDFRGEPRLLGRASTFESGASILCSRHGEHSHSETRWVTIECGWCLTHTGTLGLLTRVTYEDTSSTRSYRKAFLKELDLGITYTEETVPSIAESLTEATTYD